MNYSTILSKYPLQICKEQMHRKVFKIVENLCKLEL